MELRVDNITKHFGAKEVLKDVSFSVTGGSALGLLGRNGAGKTTTFRIVMDIFRADSGSVRLNGQPIDFGKVKMGYLPEERGLYPKSKVGEQMMYIGQLRGMSAADAKKGSQSLLEELEATDYWSRKLETLSKGNQQKIQLAIAVLHDPDVIILDEPFTGLDPVNAGMLKRLIQREVDRGKAVMFSSHQMPYVEEFCEHIAIINGGKIVLDGGIKKIKRSYPRNKIAVWPEGDLRAFVNEASQNNTWQRIVSSHEMYSNHVEILLKDAADKLHLMQLLAAVPSGMDRVQVVEPSLEEIFVSHAGEVM